MDLSTDHLWASYRDDSRQYDSDDSFEAFMSDEEWWAQNATDSQFNDQFGHPKAQPPSELDKRFWAFHKANPQVFRKLEELALQAYSNGRKKIGIGMIFEVIRWNMRIGTTGDNYKLNNSYRSRYVRILIEAHPEYKDLFETRKIKS